MNFDNLPQKNEYKFKEVTSLTGVKPYVLRFWESEFTQISPQVDEAGQKIYSTVDLEFVKRIKDLLFNEKLSIPTAKAMLDQELSLAQEAVDSPELIEQVETFQAGDQIESYAGVEMREAIGNIIMQHSHSLDNKKESLLADMEQQKEILLQKQFNDQDVLRLVQTKKKLNGVLTKLDTIIESHGWS